METVWVGYDAAYAGSNYWSIGRGQALPNDGLWDWDGPVHGDSLQGWWPIRRAYTITGGLSMSDQDRPWWALDYGNQANYVINQGTQYRRTFGVVGVWHRDSGSSAGGGVTWTPLAGSASAWCGLRRHADNAFVDAVTGNPFNQAVLNFNGENSPLPGATSKSFPGYASQWDQMLYRDIDITGAPGPNLTVSFKLRTRMSTDRDTASATRTGWFDKDPLTLASSNFISSTNAGASAPVDSFMVYVGAPVVPESGQNWLGSDGFTRPVFDPLRRWFAEVVRANEPGGYYELFSTWGNNDATITRSIPITAIQGWGNRIRLVFRVKTNRGFDDEDSGVSGYSSGTAGAAQVDDVTINLGGGTLSYGNFESASSINNSPAVSALNAWKSTGKPPAIYFHGDDRDDLLFQADPASCARFEGDVITAGDHDMGEAAGGAFGSAEQERMDGIVSPTINLAVNPASPTATNNMGLDAIVVNGFDDLCVRYDVYTGMLDLPTYGNAWTIGVQSYPASQPGSGTPCWGDLMTSTQFTDPVQECKTELLGLNLMGVVRTSNPSGIPDSIRIFMGKQQQCFRFGLTSECSSTLGAYFDNVSLGFSVPAYELDPPAFTFDQLNFDGTSVTLANSPVGRCNLTFAPAAEEAFLNLEVRLPGQSNGFWAVRNLYLPDAASAPPAESLSARFPLGPIGVAAGTALSQIEYAYVIGQTPLLDQDSTTWMPGAQWRGPVPVAHPSVTVGDMTDPPFPSAALPETLRIYLPFGPPIVVTRSSYIGCKMPNIDLDDAGNPGDLNGCGPAAAANSMIWLYTQHLEINLPKVGRTIFEQLSNLCNRLFRQGVKTADLIKAKLDFIEAHGLPIHVKYQSRYAQGDISSTSGKSHATCLDANAADFPKNSFVQSEAQKGEDVEILGSYWYKGADGVWRIVGGHAAVLSGAGTTNGVPWYMLKHDKDQKASGGRIQTVTTVDSGQVVIHLPGMDSAIQPVPGGPVYPVIFVVDGVLSESYDPTVTPPPAQVTFNDYCQWFARTLPPGGKLKVKFPQGERTFCVTVYEEERSVNPPVIHKVLTWCGNSDSTRTYVNFDTTLCVTVWVHNDDNLRSAGTYVPYTLEATVLAANVSATSSAGTGSSGGFSTGGQDQSSDEFGSPAGPSVTVDGSDGCLLSSIPAELGSGVTQLTLTHPIPTWTPGWGHLELRLAAASVAGAGNLHVSCPTSGYEGAIPISSAGTYAVDLGTIAPTSSFSITLSTQAGLHFYVDAIGLASLVPVTTDVARGELPAEAGLWTEGPNPSRTSFTARFDLPAAGQVELAVYDVAGRRMAVLASGPMPAGSHQRIWNGRDGNSRRAAAGVYFCRLRIDQRTWVQRWVMMR